MRPTLLQDPRSFQESAATAASGSCAADARPIKVALSGQLPDGLSADGWLRVTGTYVAKTAKDPVNGERIPYLDVSEAELIAAPSEQYES